MAASPKYKVYSPNGEYVASCKEAYDAVVIVGTNYPNGGTIRLGHGRILYTADSDTAESWDNAVTTLFAAEREIHAAGHTAAHKNANT